MAYFKKITKEYFICPECKEPTILKSEFKIEKRKTDKHCGNCGKYIATAYKEAMAILND